MDGFCTIEEALERIKIGKFHYFLILICGCILTSSFLELASVVSTFSISQCELQMTNVHKGVLSSIGYVGVILSSHFWGFMADTRGRKKILVLALFVSFIFTILSSVAKTFWMLLAFRFLNGVFICATQSVTYAFLGEFFSAKYRARAILINSIIYGISCLLFPFNAFIFLTQTWHFYIPILDLTFKPWRLYLIVNGLLSVLCGLALLLFIPESPKFTFYQGEEGKTLENLRKIQKWNCGKSTDLKISGLTREIDEINENICKKSFFKFVWAQTAPLLEGFYLKNLLISGYLLFAVCFAANGFLSFFPEILNKTYLWIEQFNAKASICEILELENTSVSSACVDSLENRVFISMALTTCFHIAGYILCTLLIKKFKKKYIIAFIAIFAGICPALIAFLKIPEISVYLYAIMITNSVNIQVINASTVERFPTSMRGMAMSLSMMMGRFGSIIGSNFMGMALKSFCTFTWFLPAFLLISSGIMALATLSNVIRND